ncbi:unnamed protein product [Ixodes pacificus]
MSRLPRTTKRYRTCSKALKKQTEIKHLLKQILALSDVQQHVYLYTHRNQKSANLLLDKKLCIDIVCFPEQSFGRARLLFF